MEKEFEKPKRKTTLEMFKEIKDLEVADSPLMTVEDCLPFMCEKVEKALTDKQDSERFTRLVVEKNVDIDMIKNYQTVIEYNRNTRFDRYKRKELTQEEFTFIKEMIAKYGKSI